MKGQATLMASARTGEREQDHWCTPAAVLDLVRKVAPIDCDPCTNSANPTGAKHALGPEFGTDGLTAHWPGFGLVYINAPYSQMAAWASRLAAQVERTGLRREYVALLPARTDTGWWHTLIRTRPHRVCFWKGRIKFLRPDGTPGQSAPFPSALLYWGADDLTFTRVFCERGWITRS